MGSGRHTPTQFFFGVPPPGGQGLGVFYWKQNKELFGMVLMHMMHFFSQLSTKETPGGLLYGIFGGGVQLSGPNPDLISDQNV